MDDAQIFGNERQVLRDVAALDHYAVGSIRAHSRGERRRALVVSEIPRNLYGTNGEWRGKER